MTDRLISVQDVAETTQLSPSTIYRQIKAGRFPRQITVGTASRWSFLAVQQWIAEEDKKAQAQEQTA